MKRCLTKTSAVQTTSLNIDLKARQQELEGLRQQLQRAGQQMEAAKHSAELEAQVLRQQLANAQTSVSSLQVSACGSGFRV